MSDLDDRNGSPRWEEYRPSRWNWPLIFALCWTGGIWLCAFGVAAYFEVWK